MDIRNWAENALSRRDSVIDRNTVCLAGRRRFVFRTYRTYSILVLSQTLQTASHADNNNNNASLFAFIDTFLFYYFCS